MKNRFAPTPLIALVCLLAFACFPQQAGAQLQQLTGHVPEIVKNGQAPLVSILPASQKMHLSIVLPIRNKPVFDQVIICGNPSPIGEVQPGTYLQFVNNCPSMPVSGSMYANAPRYGQSQTVSMSF